MNTSSPIKWPKKRNLFGVQVSATDYHEVVRSVIAAALRGQSAVATFLPVHGIVTAARDPEFRKQINDCEIVAPDGQPVRWALNIFHHAGLEDRVYGPHTMRRICLRAAQSGVSIYLCGSTPDVLESLRAKLSDWFPTLNIAGMESPPFRPLTEEENDAMCRRINQSGAGIVFIGMGCPRQEALAHANRDKIHAVQCCVGAAFDFHAGNKKMAPVFFQRNGLEWLFRLVQEPRRLWKRYFVTNSIFIGLCMMNAVKSLTTGAEGRMTAVMEPVNLQARPRPAASPSRQNGIVRKGFWAVMDQGLFAGSNCIVNIMLANWLSPADYGAFSTAFAAFLFLGVIHTAMLTEPMLVFAPDRYRANLRQYFAALLRGHLLISGLASLCLAATGIYLRHDGQMALGNAMLWFAATGPFTLFLWLMRRTSYAQFNPRRAAMGGVFYLILIMAGLAMLHHFTVMGIGLSLTLMGLCSLLAGLWLAVGQVHPGKLEPGIMQDVARQHWQYGRWATATQLLGYIPGNVYYFLLPKLATLEQSGALRALSNLVNPFVQANAALCLLLLPTFVRTHGTAEGKKMHRMALLVLAGPPLVYWLVLGIFNHQVIHLIYKDKYADYSGLLWVIGLQPVIGGMCGVYGSLLRARQKMNAVFWGGIVAAAAALSLGTGLTIRYGMTGVCWSIIITYGLHHVTLWLFSRKFTHRSAPQAQLAAD